MHQNDQLPTTPRTIEKARNRAKVRRNRVLGVVVSLVVGIGVVVGTVGSASADPSAGDWLKLRTCESGGNYATNTGNGYYGAYQFDLGTWASVGGSGVPSDASPATQDALAYKLWQQRGWSPWTCAAIVGLPQGGSGGPAIEVKAVHKAQPVPRPVGSIDAITVSSTRTSLRVAGWAVDRTAPKSAISVKITVNTSAYVVATTSARADVNRVLRTSGSHGFSAVLPVHAGQYKVCATAVGLKAGNNTSLGCRVVTVVGLPTGHVDSVRVVGSSVAVAGWVMDPKAPARSTRAHVYVNGVGYSIAASAPRADVNRANIPGRHGFRAAFALHPGNNSVCVTAMGVDGTHGSLGCRTVRLPPPVGSLGTVTVRGASANITGWAFQPGAPATSIQVRVAVNGTAHAVPTSSARADVNRAFSITGRHGFNFSTSLKPGVNKICATAMGTVPGLNTNLGCTTVKR